MLRKHSAILNTIFIFVNCYFFAEVLLKFCHPIFLLLRNSYSNFLHFSLLCH